MNQLKIVEGNQSQTLQMKKLNTKFQYLVSSRYQDQKYLSYLQSLQKLNKQLISMLRSKDWQNNIQALTSNIHLQNTFSFEALQEHKSLTVKLEKEEHKKKKEKIEMQQFYKKRIQELDTRIDQLRDLMSDKEISFSKVLQRLTKYQELHQPKLQNKIDDFDFVINDSFVRKIISKISNDKHKLALQMRNQKKQLNQYRAECVKLKTALSSRMNYARYKEQILSNSEIFQQTLESTADIEAQIEQSSFRLSPDPISNAKNLANLIKKQKMINDSLQRQFKQVIELNEDVINYNQLLAKSNNQKQDQLRRVKAKIEVMENKMKKYEKHFNKTLRRAKSRQTLEYNYLDLIEDRPILSYLQLLKEDVETIDINDVVPYQYVKSYSVADLHEYEREDDYQNYFGEIEQF